MTRPKKGRKGFASPRTPAPPAKPKAGALKSRAGRLDGLRSGERPGDDVAQEPVSPIRKWAAIGAASGVATIAFWTLVFAIVAPDLDTPPETTLPFYATGFAAIPLIYITLAYVSRMRHVARAALLGTMIAVGIAATFIGLGFLLGALVPVPVIAVLAFGAGGILSLRMDRTEYLRPRIWGVIATTVYTWLMLLVAPQIGIFLATLFPFNALGLADLVVDRRFQKAARTS